MHTHQHLEQSMKKWNNFMILKEQWLIVVQNVRSLWEISLQKLELKQDFKGTGAFGTGERNERGDRLIEFAQVHKLIKANALFQKPKK